MEAPVIYLVCEELDLSRVTKLGVWLKKEYGRMFDVKHISNSEIDRPFALGRGDLVISVLADADRLPMPDHPVWKQLSASGKPPFASVTFHPHLGTAPAPFKHFSPLPLNPELPPECFEDFRHFLGAFLRLQGTKVFVAHANVDGEEMARQIADFLKANQYPVFFDKERPLVGKRVIDQIAKNHLSSEAADPAGCLILVDTPGAKESEWVPKELAAAYGLQMVIIPVVWTSEPIDRPVSSRFQEMTNLAGCTVVRSSHPSDTLAQNTLRLILNRMEIQLYKEFDQRLRLAERAQEAFEQVQFSWEEENANFSVFASASPAKAGARQWKVLSHVTARTPIFRPDLGWFSEYADQPARRATFTRKFFIHDDESTEDGVLEDDGSKETVLWSRIQMTLNPNFPEVSA